MVKVNFPRGISGQTPRVRGAFYTIDSKWGQRAIAWPPKRPKAKSGYALWKNKEFGIAAAMSANPFSLDYIFADAWTKGTQQVPRDFLMMCAYGRAFEIEDIRGNVWRSYRNVNPNPQQILDQITEEPGSLLFRDTDFWRGLAKANNGNVMMLSGGKPSWQPVAIAGGGIAVTTLRRTTDLTLGVASANQIIPWETADIDELGIWDPTNPTHVVMPAVTKIRISIQYIGSTTQSNFAWRSAAYTSAGAELMPGSPRQTQIPTNTTWAVNRDISAVGPWINLPAVPYLTMRQILNTPLTASVRAGSTVTIEAQ